MDSKVEIKKEIKDVRNEISETMDELSKCVHDQFDIKEQIKSNPYHVLAGAALIGFVAGSFAGPAGRLVSSLIVRVSSAVISTYMIKKGVTFVSRSIEKIDNLK